jgi:hypothetical protein
MVARLLLSFAILTLGHACYGGCASWRRSYYNYDFLRLNVHAGSGMPYYNKTINDNGFIHRFDPSAYGTLGASLYIPFARTAGLGIGAAKTKLSFEHQAEGVFLSTGQFGVINKKYELQYFSVPLSLYFQPRNRSLFRVAYIPGILTSSKTHALFYGGASAEDIPEMMQGRPGDVQHSLLFSITSLVRINSDVYFTLEPFFNYSFDVLRETGMRDTFRPLTAGLCINLDLNLEEIGIDPFSDCRDKRSERKQKKIEELLKRKEEAERKAREQIEKMKNQDK